MRVGLLIICLGALAACAPQVPNSGADYFDNSEDARRAREIALAGSGSTQPLAVPAGQISQETTGEPLSATALPAPTAVQTTPSTTLTATSANAGDIAAETQAALEATRRNSGEAPLQASAANPAPPLLDNPGISDEQDFGAVSSRETIQSDAERIARNTQQYEQVAPTAVPDRPSSAQPNIVSYALSTSHPRGTRLHTRTGINLAARAQRACAGYASADQAQIDFLAKGGPERDRLGLDPDGDGYACQWNPAPFRRVAN
jgi:hypothetical protein